MKRLSGRRAGMDVGMLFWVTPPPAFDPTSWFEPLADSSLRQTSDASLLLVGSGTSAAPHPEAVSTADLIATITTMLPRR